MHVHLRLKVAGSILLAFALTTLASACGSDGSSSSEGGGLEKVTIQQGGTGFAWTPILVAKEKGYFKTAGLDVQLNIGGGGAKALAALLSGDIPFANAGVTSALPAVSQGRELKLIAPMANGLLSNLVVTDSTWKRIDGGALKSLDEKLRALKGTVLAVQGPGSASDTLTRYLLKSANLDPQEYLKIQSFTDQNAILAAFKAGTIDGFAYTSPTSDKAVSDFKGHYLVKIDTESPELAGLIYTGTLVRGDYAKEHADTVQKYVNAIARGANFTKNCPSQAKGIVSSSLKGLSSSLLDQAWKANLASYPTTAVMELSGVKKALEFTEANSGEKLNVDLSEFLDNSFAEKAVAELGDSKPECK